MGRKSVKIPAHESCVTAGVLMANELRRFESKYVVGESCWMWCAGVDKDGYGRFRLGKQKARANRVAYELYVGPIQPGMVVRHKCDTPRCVNPSHLELGTSADNTNDCVVRGRHPSGPGIYAGRRSYKGEAGPAAKISEADAIKIIADQRRHADIAADYGLTRAAVSHIKRGFTWAHLDRPKLHHA